MDSEMIRIKRIKTSKRFATLLGSTILVLLVIAYLSPRNTFVSTYTIIKASPESVLMVLNKPKNFNLWNPWYGQDTAVIYKTSKQASGEVNTIYWTSKNNADLTGNLKYEKSENPLKLRIIANFGRQGKGIINFSANYTESGKTVLRLDYYTDYGMHPIDRLNGIFAKYWLKNDFQRALELFKKAIEANPNFQPEPNKILPTAVDGDMLASIN